jgi:hypothetical protein
MCHLGLAVQVRTISEDSIQSVCNCYSGFSNSSGLYTFVISCFDNEIIVRAFALSQDLVLWSWIGETYQPSRIR